MDLLDKLDNEKQQEDKKLKIETNDSLSTILSGWQKIQQVKYTFAYGIYTFCESLLPQEYSVNDVIQFYLGHRIDFNQEFVYRMEGLYLSALVNHCNEKEIIFFKNYHELVPAYIGFRNRNKLTFLGDIVFNAGRDMESGILIINGNAGDMVGHLMQGGVIHIGGDYNSISRHVYGGDIYHKNKLLIKDGKPVKGAEIKWL